MAMNLKYGIEDKPSTGESIVYGLQWLAVTLPAVIVMGKVLGGMDNSSVNEIMYMQKLFVIMGAVLIIQIVYGHRLPVVVGPATILLIAILASKSSSVNAIYSSIMVGGLILSLISMTGLFGYISRLFTPRVVAVILLLVAFTMTPTILNLITGVSGGGSATSNVVFAMVFIIAIFAGHRLLSGLWRSTLVLWALIVGTIVYLLLHPGWSEEIILGNMSFVGACFQGTISSFTIEAGTLIAFLLCFLGLAINDLGSIQAVGEVLRAPDMEKRISHGITVTGLGNAVSGLMGVIGPVNFSFSPGVIASTGCASRYTLIPAGAVMCILGFFPRILSYLYYIPGVVIGCILLYIMCTQAAAGLLAAVGSLNGDRFDNALLIGLPILLGIIIAFLPPEALQGFPSSIRPVVGNGFVVGVLCSLLLEHVIFRHN